MSGPLDGRRALVTGSGMGIGQGIARELAFQACARVMGADRAFPLEEESVLGRLQNLLGGSDAVASRLLVLATR